MGKRNLIISLILFLLAILFAIAGFAQDSDIPAPPPPNGDATVTQNMCGLNGGYGAMYVLLDTVNGIIIPSGLACNLIVIPMTANVAVIVGDAASISTGGPQTSMSVGGASMAAPASPPPAVQPGPLVINFDGVNVQWNGAGWSQ
jgi:hypothetical protein